MERINNTGKSDYTYFAFISYKSQDIKWARWLKRQLQGYRLPAKTHERHNELPQQCSPVFLDKSNLTPGPLNKRLRSEVQSSKFLIVICSRYAHENSKYLDDELRYYLEGTGTQERVIPFIIDETNHPVEECFPDALGELCTQNSIVGVNVHDDGKRTALLKVIAAMLGIKLEELESDDSRRRRKRTTIVASATTLLMASIIAILSIAWHKTALSERQFRTILSSTYALQGSTMSEEEKSEEALLYFVESLSADPENRRALVGSYFTLKSTTWPFLVATSTFEQQDSPSAETDYNEKWGTCIHTSSDSQNESGLNFTAYLSNDEETLIVHDKNQNVFVKIKAPRRESQSAMHASDNPNDETALRLREMADELNAIDDAISLHFEQVGFNSYQDRDEYIRYKIVLGGDGPTSKLFLSYAGQVFVYLYDAVHNTDEPQEGVMIDQQVLSESPTAKTSSIAVSGDGSILAVLGYDSILRYDVLQKKWLSPLKYTKKINDTTMTVRFFKLSYTGKYCIVDLYPSNFDLGEGDKSDIIGQQIVLFGLLGRAILTTSCDLEREIIDVAFDEENHRVVICKSSSFNVIDCKTGDYVTPEIYFSKTLDNADTEDGNILITDIHGKTYNFSLVDFRKQPIENSYTQIKDIRFADIGLRKQHVNTEREEKAVLEIGDDLFLCLKDGQLCLLDSSGRINDSIAVDHAWNLSRICWYGEAPSYIYYSNSSKNSFTRFSVDYLSHQFTSYEEIAINGYEKAFSKDAIIPIPDGCIVRTRGKEILYYSHESQKPSKTITSHHSYSQTLNIDYIMDNLIRIDAEETDPVSGNSHYVSELWDLNTGYYICCADSSKAFSRLVSLSELQLCLKELKVGITGHAKINAVISEELIAAGREVLACELDEENGVIWHF